MLQAASRFGTLHLRRQVIAHSDERPHLMAGNVLLPVRQGKLITRGLQEQVYLFSQDVPFAMAARLLGSQAAEPGLLSAGTLRRLVRETGQRLRVAEQAVEDAVLYRNGGEGRLRPRPGLPPSPRSRHLARRGVRAAGTGAEGVSLARGVAVPGAGTGPPARCS